MPGISVHVASFKQGTSKKSNQRQQTELVYNSLRCQYKNRHTASIAKFQVDQFIDKELSRGAESVQRESSAVCCYRANPTI